jgi:hypothetical protein
MVLGRCALRTVAMCILTARSHAPVSRPPGIGDLDVNHDGAASIAELDQSTERVYDLVKQHVHVDTDSAPNRHRRAAP